METKNTLVSTLVRWVHSLDGIKPNQQGLLFKFKKVEDLPPIVLDSLLKQSGSDMPRFAVREEITMSDLYQRVKEVFSLKPIY